MANNFGQVMALLPSLSPAELATVAFHAQSLRAGASGRVTARQSRRKPATGKKGGPAKQASAFADDPTYAAFKAADKTLKVLLKSKQLDLKELQARLATQVEPESQRILDAFLKVRNEWFLAKAGKQAKPVTTATPPLYEEEKKAPHPKGEFKSLTQGPKFNEGPFEPAKPAPSQI